MKMDEWNIAVQPAGDAWRQGRKLLQATLTPREILKYQPVQLRNARAFLKTLRQDYNDLHSSVRG